MPSDITRKVSKFACRGIDLAHPVDAMPEGYYPIVKNVRSIVEGTVEITPGYVAVGSAQINGGQPLHSIRRMSNLLPGATPTNSEIFIGTGTSLFMGQREGPFIPVTSGFSGDPLSSIIFRPDQSPEPWLYIGDRNKQVKVNNEGVVRNVGVLPPNDAPTPDMASVGGVRGVVNNGIIADGDNPSGWVGAGTGGTIAVNTRVPGGTTVSGIIYDQGSNGWCLMSPQNSPGAYGFLQPGCRLVITGIGGPETVTVTDVTSDITDTTITAIQYDTANTGLCSISLATQTPQLQRNSILLLSTDAAVRVLSVTQGPDGLSSFRCFDPTTHHPADIVRSVVSFRCFTTISVPSLGGIPLTSTTITGGTFEQAVAGGTGTATHIQTQDLSLFAFVNGQNRPLQPDDYMHISLRFDNPTLITQGRIMLDIDPQVNDFTQNYYSRTFTQADLASVTSGSLSSSTAGSAQWTELVFPLSDMIRVGSNQAANLATVHGARVELTVTGAVIMDFGAWYVTGSYGPNVVQNSPEGIQYRYRYRDSRTGAISIPSPVNRYQLYPQRQRIDVGVTASTDPQVDMIDVERFDPTLASFNYVGSLDNITGVFTDDTQSSLIAGNPALETNVVAPWPVLDVPKSGIVNVAGTSVQWVSGDLFQTALLPGTTILINGDAVQIYGNPASTTFLQIQDNLGALTGVPYSIGSPVLMGQTLPYVFGPLEGPTAVYSFAIGDRRNPGTLYYSIGNNLDAASDKNTVEICSPSEPLVSGCVWQTLVYVASNTRVFLVTPSFSQNADGSSSIVLTSTALSSTTGVYSPWGMCAGSKGVYMVGKDGLYLVDYNSSTYYSKQLYPLFPHDGENAKTVNGFDPVNMNSATKLRLSYCDTSVMFDYQSTPDGGVSNAPATMRIDQNGDYWPRSYADQVLCHYWEEEIPVEQEGLNLRGRRMLMGTNNGYLLEASESLTDNGQPLNGFIRTPSFDFGDPRSLKLFMDMMTDADAAGGYAVTVGFNNYSVTLPPFGVGAINGRIQYLNGVSGAAAAEMKLYRNIAVNYQIGAGTVLYEFEPTYYLQPFFSTIYTTQLSDHGIPGWKQLRFGRIAVISGSNVRIQILNDDGATLNDFTVPPTNGILKNYFVQLQNGSKGRMLRYTASSDSEFVLFTEQTFVRVKKWAGPQFLEVRPFLQ